MIRVCQTIVVEGRYDKNKLSQIFDAVIIDLAGFGIFKDGQKLALLRRMAQGPGLLILTDSDGAGFVIRNYLKGAIQGKVWHAYIPQREGKEKRKRTAGREGLLGVEGMPDQVIIDAVRRSGALDAHPADRPKGCITKLTLYELGLTGGEQSRTRRHALCKRLDLPVHLGTNTLIQVLNAITDPEGLTELALQL